jgi:hypothetical protein
MNNRLPAHFSLTRVLLPCEPGPDVVSALVSGIHAMEHDESEFSELRYQESLRSGLFSALTHVIRLGNESDFAPGSALRAFVIDNADVIREAVLTSPASGMAVAPRSSDSGTAVVERLLMFVI